MAAEAVKLRQHNDWGLFARLLWVIKCCWLQDGFIVLLLVKPEIRLEPSLGQYTLQALEVVHLRFTTLLGFKLDKFAMRVVLVGAHWPWQ